MKETSCIRREKKEEYRQVENLVRDCFWNVYRPGCLEHYVLHCLRKEDAFVPELALVMEENGQLIGQNTFMKSVILADDGREIPVLTMGPIGILPKKQRQGYGRQLVEESLRRAKKLGFGAVFLEGNLEFYGTCGFQKASAFGIRYHGLEEGMDSSFFLGKELIPSYLEGITGEYVTPGAYFIDEEAAGSFDKEFPYKEKKKLPGQLFG